MSVKLRRELELHVPAEPRVVQNVREQFEEFIRPLHLTADEVDSLKVALSEACSNAVCHGSPRGRRNQVHLRFAFDEEQLVIEIVDEGKGFRPSQIALPDYEEWKPSGRGLFLMQALMDDVEFEPCRSGTRVRLTKYLAVLAPEVVPVHRASVPGGALAATSLQAVAAYQDMA